MDIIKIKDKSSTAIAKIRNDLIDFETYAIMPIEDAKTAKKAGDLLKGAKQFREQIEDKRKELVKPFKDPAKLIDEKIRPYREKLDKFIAELSVVIYNYKKEQNRLAIESETRRRQEEEARLKEERERLEKEALENNSSIVLDEIKKVDHAIEKINEKPIETYKGISSGYSLTTVKEHWVYEIQDAKLVPKEYLEPSDRIIKEAIKNGVREIPGLIIKDIGTVRSI